MLLKILAVIVVILVGIVIYAALQPADYTISRSIVIAAPAEKIFPYLNNQKLAEKWGPWSEVDPDAKMSYSGPDEGVGAKASWNSKGQLGTGSATIIKTVPNELVSLQLEYTKPMNMRQVSDYIINSQSAGTLVTWQVNGTNTLTGRVFCLFFNMDKTVGGMFEKGLSNLKSLVEKQ